MRTSGGRSRAAAVLRFMSFWRRFPILDYQNPRRKQIRDDRPDTLARRWGKWRDSGVIVSLQIAAVFFVGATAILMMHDQVVPYRPGQYAHHDIISRVDFVYMDKQRLSDAQNIARQTTPHVYTQVSDAWKELEDRLLALP